MSYINLLEIIYPIGSLYCSIIDESPASVVGGTWSKIDEGYYLMGAGNTYKSTVVGGSNSITLSVNQIPSHKHGLGIHQCSYEISGCGLRNSNTVASWFTDRVMLATTASSMANSYNTGGGQAYSNMPAYYPLHMWVRTN